MTEYFAERIAIEKRKLELAYDGFKKELESAAEAIEAACLEERDMMMSIVEKTVDSIKYSRLSIMEIQSSLNNAIERYEQEVQKSKKKFKAKEILFGVAQNEKK